MIKCYRFNYALMRIDSIIFGLSPHTSTIHKRIITRKGDF